MSTNGSSLTDQCIEVGLCVAILLVYARVVFFLVECNNINGCTFVPHL